jgi:hypothetical protein
MKNWTRLLKRDINRFTRANGLTVPAVTNLRTLLTKINGRVYDVILECPVCGGFRKEIIVINDDSEKKSPVMEECLDKDKPPRIMCPRCIMMASDLTQAYPPNEIPDVIRQILAEEKKESRAG